MKLKIYTDYALRVLIYLSINSHRKCTVKEVSERFAISYNHTAKVVNHLSNYQYIQAQKGKGGGILLLKKPSDIQIGKVIRDLEEDFALVECFKEGCDKCNIMPVCKLKSILFSAYQAFMAELDQYSLEDITENKDALLEILELT